MPSNNLNKVYCILALFVLLLALLMLVQTRGRVGTLTKSMEIDLLEPCLFYSPVPCRSGQEALDSSDALPTGVKRHSYAS
jgi:hypothetical protein